MELFEIISAVLLIASLFFGYKWAHAKGKFKKAIDIGGDALDLLRVWNDAWKDDKVTEMEWQKIKEKWDILKNGVKNNSHE